MNLIKLFTINLLFIFSAQSMKHKGKKPQLRYLGSQEKKSWTREYSFNHEQKEEISNFCRQSDLGAIKKCLEIFTTDDQRTDLYNLLLFLAPLDRQLAVIQFLIDNCINDPIFLSNLNMALLYAVKVDNNLEIIKILIDNGANVVKANAFQTAIDCDTSDALKFLIKLGSPINSATGWHDNKVGWRDIIYEITPLEYAIHQSRAQAVKCLLENGADIADIYPVKGCRGFEAKRGGFRISALDYAKIRYYQVWNTTDNLDNDVSKWPYELRKAKETWEIVEEFYKNLKN